METPKKDIQGISLSELNQRVKQSLKSNFSEVFWLVAEISELKVNAAGHCYLELIEKDRLSDKIIAKARGNIWAFTFRLLKPYFETTARTSLTAGLKVFIAVQVEFHEVYGYSLNITDIDPTYTLGDMARQRAETIERLKAEGVYGMNRSLELPLVPQQIAVISSATAAGYGDFRKHMLHNEQGLRFSLELFPSFMQGDEAVDSIISSLERIYACNRQFDAVIIIRGGGSQSDLSCFDNYWLASHVAQFPLPVLTGIGHEQDESVVDLVAHRSFKTPTAVADFLIARARDVYDYFIELESQFASGLNQVLSDKKSELQQLAANLTPVTREALQKRDREILSVGMNLRNAWFRVYSGKNNYLGRLEAKSSKVYTQLLHDATRAGDMLQRRLSIACRNFAKQQQQSLEKNKKLLDSLDPVHVLKRGFSITFRDGRLLRDPHAVSEGDLIETHLSTGKIRSRVTYNSGKEEDSRREK